MTLIGNIRSNKLCNISKWFVNSESLEPPRTNSELTWQARPNCAQGLAKLITTRAKIQGRDRK